MCSGSELFRPRKQSRNEENRKKYCEAKDAKRVAYMAIDEKSKVPKAKRRWIKLIRVVMVVSCLELPSKKLGEKKYVFGVSFLKDESRAVKVNVDDGKEIWKEHMKKLMTVENEWSGSIDASKVEGAVRRIDVEEVRCAMICMKIGKASGPSGVAIELFKTFG